MRDVLKELEQWTRDDQRVALATVVSVTGSAPRGVGACLAVNGRGQIAGSISGGCVEPEVIEACRRVLRTGETTVLRFGITEEQNVEKLVSHAAARFVCSCEHSSMHRCSLNGCETNLALCRQSSLLVRLTGQAR